MEKKHTCIICKEKKPESDFYPNRSRPQGVHSRCKTCDKRRDRKEYMREYMAKNQKEHPEKWMARKLARANVTKLPCQVCGDDKSEAHHEDYSRPLDVVWLCHKHHFQVERGVIKLETP